jgi:hypothetical protein
MVNVPLPQSTIEITGCPVFTKARRLDPNSCTQRRRSFASCPDSPWSSLLPMVHKKDRLWNPCVDYRCLNLATSHLPSQHRFWLPSPMCSLWIFRRWPNHSISARRGQACTSLTAFRSSLKLWVESPFWGYISTQGSSTHWCLHKCARRVSFLLQPAEADSTTSTQAPTPTSEATATEHGGELQGQVISVVQVPSGWLSPNM